MSAIRAILSFRAFIVKDKKILLVCRSVTDRWNPGKWECPGGKPNEGEHFDDALIREVFEETGLQVQIISGISFVVNDIAKAFQCEGIPHATIFRFVSLETGEPALSHEHGDFVWASYDMASAYDLTQETKKALRELQMNTSLLP